MSSYATKDPKGDFSCNQSSSERNFYNRKRWYKQIVLEMNYYHVPLKSKKIFKKDQAVLDFFFWLNEIKIYAETSARN